MEQDEPETSEFGSEERTCIRPDTRRCAQKSRSQPLYDTAGWTAAQRTLPTSTLCKSSSAHVFPIENDPFAFCFALWSL